MLKRLATALIVFFVASGWVQAQPVAGVEYRQLSAPQATDIPGKIEVVEFFWYGCPHCYEFEPVLTPWLKKLPKDVYFRRVPAMFNEEYAQGARAFYALEALGAEERLHKALFDAVHTGDRLRLGDEAALTAWVGKHGVDTKKFAAAYRSFSVEARMKRAAQLTQAYKIEGVPTMAVDGKYVVNTESIRSFQQLLSITDYLIDKVRSSGKGAAKK